MITEKEDFYQKVIQERGAFIDGQGWLVISFGQKYAERLSDTWPICILGPGKDRDREMYYTETPLKDFPGNIVFAHQSPFGRMQEASHATTTESLKCNLSFEEVKQALIERGVVFDPDHKGYY